MSTKIADIRDQLNVQFLERQDVVEASAAALVAKEHLLLIGPPGTAKSMIADAWTARIYGARLCSLLLTKFSTPEEIFGPLKLSLLKEDQYARNLENYLCDAEIAFVDEALDLTTTVPTPDGWTTMGEVAVGDYVLGSNGSPVRVTAVTTTSTDHACYRVSFSSGESIVADAGHNWYVRPGYSKGHWKVYTTQQMVDYSAKNKQTGKFFHLPNVAAVELPAKDLPADPYTLGLWLGNGNNWTGELYIRDDWAERTLKEVQRAYPEASFGRMTSERMQVISLGNTGFRTQLNSLGLIQNKHIPAEFLRGSIDQRLALLQGLMDTDGYINNPSCVFSNTNENVIDGCLELIQTLGSFGTKVETKDDRIGKNGPHATCWKVTFAARHGLWPFLSRGETPVFSKRNRWNRIVGIEQVDSVPVRCITVDSPDHLFLAGRSMVPTHNCFKANSAILNSMLKVMNERKYRDNGVELVVPLLSMFAASNELPDGEELGALFDRLLVRLVVDYIKEPGNFVKLLKGEVGPPEKPALVTIEELRELQDRVPTVTIPEVILESVRQLRDKLHKDGVIPGDRRWRASMKLMQANAVIEDRDTVTQDDLALLRHALWLQPMQIKTVERAVLEMSNPNEREALELLDQIEEMRSAALALAGSEESTKSKQGVEYHTKLRKLGTRLQKLRVDAESAGRSTTQVVRAQAACTGTIQVVLREILGIPIGDDDEPK